MKRQRLATALGVLAGALLSASNGLRADEVVYWDSEGGFFPPVVVIGPGDFVYWVNYDLYGFPVQVTSDAPFGEPNYFSFYLIDFGDNGGVQFNNQGTFGYHSSYSDQGYVVVNIPPVVTITNPLNHAVFPAPATFDIQVEASETPDDVVWDVEFWLGTATGTNFIVLDSEAPFSASVTNLAAGTYTLIAIATDYYYATATNAITVTVGSAGPILLGAPRVAGNQFLFDVTGLTVGKTNVVQRSTNLTDWVPVQTNVAAAVSTTITNAVSPGALCYRVVQWP